jgi:hypothetical protein
MRRSTPVAIFLVAATALAFAQNGAIPPNVLAEIQNALKNIAVKNYTVENIIYDGMTYKEVTQILGVDDFDISFHPDWAAYFGYGYGNLSFHGNYVLFWSDSSSFSDPTVIGYSNIRTKRILHNTLR